MQTFRNVLYLASQSPRRREILTRMKIQFRVVPSQYHERFIQGHSPAMLALRHAVGKARKAVLPSRARFVMGADTVVACKGQILGKPADEKAAYKMLSLLSGRMNTVMTAVALWDRRDGVLRTEIVSSKVFIKKMSPEERREYIRRSHPYDKAGGYAIQGGPRIARRISGSYSNIVGFPREKVSKMLTEIGF